MWRHVKETLSSLTWEMLAREIIKKHRRLALRLEALYLVKNILCLYFSPIPKLWSRKKIIFKVFVFRRYSKTLIWHKFIVDGPSKFLVTFESVNTCLNLKVKNQIKLPNVVLNTCSKLVTKASERYHLWGSLLLNLRKSWKHSI